MTNEKRQAQPAPEAAHGAVVYNVSVVEVPGPVLPERFVVVEVGSAAGIGCRFMLGEEGAGALAKDLQTAAAACRAGIVLSGVQS